MNKLKRLGMLLVAFLVLTSVNLFITVKSMSRINKTALINNILNEIARSSPLKTPSFSQILGVEDEIPRVNDERTNNLKSFFRKYNSPLYDYADVIVGTADKHRFDYRLLPAIAMQESNVCRVIPNNSYNCWGWGIYGTKVTRFASYEEAIMTISKGIKEHYIDKGLTTPSEIMQKYTPSSNGSWANGVNTFLKMLE